MLTEVVAEADPAAAQELASNVVKMATWRANAPTMTVETLSRGLAGTMMAATLGPTTLLVEAVAGATTLPQVAATPNGALLQQTAVRPVAGELGLRTSTTRTER